jgi:hypothetical protein
MQVPDFVLRKLYRRGSLRETGNGRFSLTLQNPLGTATIVGPPIFVINGIAYKPDQVAGPVDFTTLSPEHPFVFRKGDVADVAFPGRLLRGGNRIHLAVPTVEFGEIEVYVEDLQAAFCDLPQPEDVPAAPV